MGGEKDADDGHAEGHVGRRGAEATVLHIEEMEEEAVSPAEAAVARGETREGTCMNHEEVTLASCWEESG
jgi:hypothetical protein